MFKQKYFLEVKGAEGRMHTYICPPTTPPGEAYDALYTMLLIVGEQIKSDLEKLKKEECKCKDKSAKECEEKNDTKSTT